VSVVAAAAFHFGGHGNRASAIFAHGADSKEMIVRGHSFQTVRLVRPRNHNCPTRLAVSRHRKSRTGALGVILAGHDTFASGVTAPVSLASSAPQERAQAGEHLHCRGPHFPMNVKLR